MTPNTLALVLIKVLSIYFFITALNNSLMFIGSPPAILMIAFPQIFLSAVLWIKSNWISEKISSSNESKAAENINLAQTVQIALALVGIWQLTLAIPELLFTIFKHFEDAARLAALNGSHSDPLFKFEYIKMLVISIKMLLAIILILGREKISALLTEIKNIS